MNRKTLIRSLGKVLNTVFFFADDEKERAKREKEDLDRFSDGVGSYNVPGEHMTADEAKAHRDLHSTDYDY